MDCPKCIGRLSKITVQLYTASENPQVRGETLNIDLDQCFACNGIWFDRGELEKYLQEHMSAVNAPAISRELLDKLDKKPAKCPHCDIVMKKRPAPNDPSVLIDQCKKCQGIWLDSSEINLLEESGTNITQSISTFIKRIFGQ
ncbi:MAG: zf-TFIIB domain-containing protein [Chlamydiota bacterium]|nr:zf-TFIIB domain-containing protein [Chlamydiota bacterium]